MAIIVAAGSGERAGRREKQFALLLGKPVIAWSAEVLRTHPEISRIVIVVPPGRGADLPWLADFADDIVDGGATRTQSVQAGLAALCTGPDTKVLIHDAARPGLTKETVDDLIAALDTYEGAAPGLPVVDALKRVAPDGLTTVSRDQLYRVQTPQAFRHGAISTALAGEGDLVDDLAAIERQGGQVAIVPGSERLKKITYAEDFALVEKLMALSTDAPPRMGTGFDVHTFGPGEFITLCGLEVPHTHGVVGHSDADVAWHALTDAILGAMALGDIGDHFPPSDPKWKGAPSKLFLAHAARLAAEAGYGLANVDITIICEAPKVKPYREAMRSATADLLGLPLSAVSIKATTTEGLGFTGRREGIAAQAAAVLTSRIDPA